MGRNKKAENELKIKCSVRLEPAYMSMLEYMAGKLGITKTQIIQDGIQANFINFMGAKYTGKDIDGNGGSFVETLPTEEQMAAIASVLKEV